MVKALSDLCLGCIQHNLNSIPHLGANLPTLYKERLLERLAYHDLLHKSYLPHIYSNLFCAALTHIKLYKCEQVDDSFLLELAASKCQLEVLVLNSCVQVTDMGVQAITSEQRKLCVLELKKLPKLTSAGLSAIASDILWHVYIKRCPLITCNGVGTMTRQCQSIKVLHICQCSKLERQVYAVVAQNLGPILEDLKIDLQGITDQELVPLSKNCPNLKKLNLTGAKSVGKEGLIKLFQGCTKLENLDLSYCSRLAKPDECHAFWTLPQTLKKLSLCGILVDDEEVFVESMQRLRSLTSVRLCGVLALNDSSLTRVLKHIGHNLTFLDISGGFNKLLTDEGLQAISMYCIKLEELCLSLLSQIHGYTLAPMFQNPERAANIRKLYLSCRKLDPSFVSLIASACHELTLLEFSGLSFINDDLLFQVAENCPKLSHLAIKGCRQVTDDAVCELARRCSLRSLVLSGIHNLTDKCIFVLANSCPQLEEIFMNGCDQISPIAVRYLSDCCIGRLSVRHCIPNARPNQLMARNLDTGEFCRVDVMPLISNTL